MRHARVPAGSSVLVIGCGGVGLNVAQGGGTYYGSVRPNIDFPIVADLDIEKKIALDS
jgi:hypothetical protein